MNGTGIVWRSSLDRVETGLGHTSIMGCGTMRSTHSGVVFGLQPRERPWEQEED